MGLWGFEPSIEAAQLHENNIWNWRKLVLAGILVSSLVVNTMSSNFKPGVCVTTGLVIIAVWVLALLMFWKFAIQANPDANRTIAADDTSSVVKPSEAWLKKAKSTDGDNRLPVTVVTGN